MKILFIIESMGIGGSERSLNALLRNMDFCEHTVELLLLDDSGIFLKNLPPDIKITIWNQTHFPFLKRIEFFIKRKLNLKNQHNAQYFWEVFQKQFAEVSGQYDVAIAYSQGFATYFTAEKINAQKKIAWVNIDFELDGYNMKSDARFYQKFDNVAVVSIFLKKQLKILLNQFGVSVPMNVFYDITSPEEVHKQISEIPKEMQIKTLRLLTVGRMVYQKGYDLAVETAALLKGKGLEFCWYFVGDGVEVERIRNLIDQQKLNGTVKILGFQENPYAYMNACDIYVQPSRYEGWGLTSVEAKILGKPVVTTNFPTASEIIRDGETGFITGMTAKVLAEKIELLMNDKTLREKLSKDNIAEVEERNQQTLDRFSELINQK